LMSQDSLKANRPDDGSAGKAIGNLTSNSKIKGITDVQQASASPRPKSPPYSPEDVGKPGDENFQHSSCHWSELTELIGPLRWPLLNVDTNAFSSDPEFRPFLKPDQEGMAYHDFETQR